MVSFCFRLELQDGTSADPPSLHTAVPNWRDGEPQSSRLLNILLDVGDL
jgi:hypothetical protein